MNKASCLGLALLGGCVQAPHEPARDADYAAAGAAPFWTLAIEGDRMLLTRAGEDGLHSTAFPRVPPQQAGGTTRWEYAEGTRVITVEARPGPCEGPERQYYEDRVTVSLSGVRLEGCGGNLIEGRAG